MHEAAISDESVTSNTGRGQKPPQKNLTVSEVFGQTTSLMTQSHGHRNMFISDLEWMAMLAPSFVLTQKSRSHRGANRRFHLSVH